MESPDVFPETPMETPLAESDEVVYPCKGCGEILEEGKAFELAGNRWHIDCFRCNTCGTLLDSDANLLLLGDGSLICNNCTYSCSACGDKIEDLAILTGEQAFCASCFKCRNCKRRIENLRYARTSQGIFCMACHESLMARRRKRSKASRQHTATLNGAVTSVFDKSLPALPPTAALLPAELETPPSEGQTDTPSNMSPTQGAKPRLRSKKEASSHDLKRAASPDDAVRRENPLPSGSYERRPSSLINAEQDTSNADDGLFVPLALDNNPTPPPAPQTRRRKLTGAGNEATTTAEETKAARDYFSRVPHSGSHREAMKENGLASSPRSNSTEREPHRSASGNSKPASSPHIAYQEKGWQASSDKIETLKRRKEQSYQATDSPDTTTEKVERPRPQLNSQVYPLRSSTNSDIFKLQEVPKSKRADSRRSSKSDTTRSPTNTSPVDAIGSKKLGITESPMEGGLPSDETLQSADTHYEDAKSRQISPEMTKRSQMERPTRGDSLSAMRPQPQSAAPQTTLTKTLTESQGPTPYKGHERKASSSSIPAALELSTSSPKANGGVTISKPIESPISKSVLDPPAPPSRSSSRRSPTSNLPANDSFTSPRAPPPAPSSESRHKVNGSVGSIQTEYTEAFPSTTQATIPENSATGELSIEDEMARIIRNEDGTVNGSMMRRVSNAVKHGRSFSDRGSQKWRSPGSNEWNSPKAGGMEISSPLFPSADGKEDVSQLKNQLRRAQSRITELETEKNGLLEKVHGSADMQQVNTELRQKRSTMAFLDTQKEMVIRELEVMTEHLSQAKDSGKPLDLTQLQSDILSEFANALQKLKSDLELQIEDLIHRRNELTDEISSLIQMKDKGFQEYESLSTKNHQLNELNSQLVHNIQNLYKANRQPGNSLDGGRPTASGLGIYTHQKDNRSESSTTTTTLIDQRSVSTPVVETPLAATIVGPEDTDSATVLNAPQVINIRKGQPKKFNWKKGGQGVAKNITKGLKGAFASGDRFPSGQMSRDGPYNIDSTPYGQMPRNDSAESSSMIREREREGSQTRATHDQGSRERPTPGFGGFFGSAQKERERGNALKPATNAGLKQTGSNSNLMAPEPPSVLFGSDLTSRCYHEHLAIPSVVAHCITEVETRGMNQEGIYRKSGGSGQVKVIQVGFEKDGDYDISDPDLDIHAITSALKQYFRKLPMPLITHEVYDLLVEAVRNIEDGSIRANTVRSAVATLPRCHYDVLEVLMLHLARVMDHERENLMTPHNVAVVFAPTIMRPPTIQQEMEDMLDQRKVVQTMLENAKVIFASGGGQGSQGSRSASALSGADSGSGVGVLKEEHVSQQQQPPPQHQSVEKQIHPHQAGKEYQDIARRLPIPR